MRVFYKGFNLYNQFWGKSAAVLDNFHEQLYEKLRDVEFTQTFAVLLVADSDIVYQHGNEFKIIKSDISQFTCTDDLILLLTKTNQLLKIDNLENLNEIKEVPKFWHPTEGGDEIIKISSNSKINVALSREGKLYNIPIKLEYENKDLIDLKTGREHCVLLDKTGNVYTFGSGSRGQLGHGTLDNTTEPTLVKALAGIPIKAIAANGWHSCAISQEGDLYIWGWNGNGQIGLAKNGNTDCVSVMASPHVVDFDDLETNVTKVACGNRHTIAVLDNNKLYGCGWNKYKQLTNCEQENFYGMTFLDDFSNKDVVDVKCGPWSSVVLCK